jgi:hypothetical protein
MFTSPEMRCDKNTALSLLYRTSPRTVFASNISTQQWPSCPSRRTTGGSLELPERRLPPPWSIGFRLPRRWKADSLMAAGHNEMGC